MASRPSSQPSPAFASRFCFFFNDTATTEIYTLSLHDALPISRLDVQATATANERPQQGPQRERSEEHTSELQSRRDLVCRLLLEKKNKTKKKIKHKKKKKKEKK